MCLIILLIVILIHTTWSVIRCVHHWHWLDYLLVVDHASTQLVLFLFDCFTVICLVPACWLCTRHQSLVFESLFIFFIFHHLQVIIIQSYFFNTRNIIWNILPDIRFNLSALIVLFLSILVLKMFLNWKPRLWHTSVPWMLYLLNWSYHFLSKPSAFIIRIFRDRLSFNFFLA